MYISKFRVFNYKSFKDSTLLEFKPGINIIIGQNNVGKTAFLEALELNVDNTPHKNVKAWLSKKEDKSLPSFDWSTVDIILVVEESDIYSFIKKSTICVSSERNHQNDLDLFQNWINQPNVKEICVYNYNPEKGDGFYKIDINMPENINISHPCSYDYNISFGQETIQKIIINNSNNLELNETPIDFTPSYEPLDKYFFDYLRSKIYRLESERFHVGKCDAGASVELKQSAENLAEVISQLQLAGQKKNYQQFNECVNIIFPEIALVSARPKPKKSINDDKLLYEVLIWSLEASQQDVVEMTLPLADCGTGVSQVLAILYVVITASEPQVIIIDEPQSFLHPSAAKKLIEILKEFPQHQYFIATHSPQIITAANPATIVQLSYIDGETKAQIIDAKQTAQLRFTLR
ncbi:MAG: AAA family ATPase [Planktothrix sp. GU0601_MAG3]|nr:MAG: AAA family ATPase [Planktothrix sp. GU0601_MAG3]